MITKIERGEVVRCLACDAKIELDSNTLLFDADGEYIRCPKCNATYDIHQYMMYGTNVSNDQDFELYELPPLLPEWMIPTFKLSPKDDGFKNELKLHMFWHMDLPKDHKYVKQMCDLIDETDSLDCDSVPDFLKKCIDKLEGGQNGKTKIQKRQTDPHNR